MDLLKNFHAIIEALNTHHVEYVLIGGYAVILHGLPRTTVDMDLMLKMNEHNIRKFREALNSIYNDKDIEEINLTELKKYAVIRYGTPDNFYVDIMAKIGDIANFEDIEFEEKKIEGLVIRLATPEALYKLKSQSLRPQDQSDAMFLKELLKKVAIDMSLQKFKSLRDAQEKLWNFNPNRDYYISLADLFKLAFKYNKLSCETGVFKFKTLQQANLHRIQSIRNKNS